MWWVSVLVFALDCGGGGPKNGVGSPCTSDEQCSAGASGATCVTAGAAAALGYDAPGGYCTAVGCSQEVADSCGEFAQCLKLPGADTTACFQTCIVDSQCRSGFVCEDSACVPECVGENCAVDLSGTYVDLGFGECDGGCPGGGGGGGQSIATENIQNVQNVQSTETVQGVAENTENVQDTENVGSQDTESTSGGESVSEGVGDDARRRHKKSKPRAWWRLWQ